MTTFLERNLDAIRKQATGIPETLKQVQERKRETISGKQLVVFMGAGDSYAVAEYGRWAFLSVNVRAIAVSPPELSRIPLSPDTVVVGITASGRSLATIAALEQARQEEITTVVLTDNPAGRACECADHMWLTHSGVDSYNISPSSPTTCAMAFLLKMAALKEEAPHGPLYEDTHLLQKTSRSVLQWAETVGPRISDIVSLEKPIYLVSDGPNYVAAQLGMMKFNEQSLVKGIAVLREEFQHHCNLSINDDDRVILISDSPITEEDARYMRILTSTLRTKAFHLHTTEELGLISPLGQAIANTIALQIAALLHVKKHDPEKERFKLPNAEAFKIY